MPRDGPKPEFELSSISDHYVTTCQAFVQQQAELGCFDHYAGVPVSRILHAIDSDGGWFVEEHGHIRGIALAPQITNRVVLLPLPMLDARATHRGVQCLLQSVQVTAVFHRISPEDQLVGIAVDFPHDRPPSAQAIREFGMCADTVNISEEAIEITSHILRRFVILPELFPSVAAETLKLLGLRAIRTTGKTGEAWIYCPLRYSPLRESYRWLLEQIATGRLSVIGLPDIPDQRFG